MSLTLALIQKRGLHSLRLLLLMKEFSVFMLLQDIAPGNGWLENKINIWRIKMREMKTKQYLNNLILLWVEWKK